MPPLWKLTRLSIAIFASWAGISGALAENITFPTRILPGRTYFDCALYAVNDAGVAVGFAGEFPVGAHPYVLTPTGSTERKEIGRLNDISNAGLIVGYDQANLYASKRAVTISEGILTPVFPGETSSGSSDNLGSVANAVNDAGQVVGQSSSFRAFLSDHGVITDIGALLESPTSSAIKINSGGTVLGTGGGRSGAFLYKDGTVTYLGTLGGDSTTPIAINDQGWVVGSSKTADGTSHAFLYRDGEMTDLGTLGGQNSTAAAINNRGAIVGWAEDANENPRAFVYRPGDGLTDLGTLGGLRSWATGINDSGQIVGRSSTFDGAFVRAFLHQHGVMADLNRLTDLPLNEYGLRGYFLTDARGISSTGHIVGTLSSSAYKQTDGGFVMDTDAAIALPNPSPAPALPVLAGPSPTPMPPSLPAPSYYAIKALAPSAELSRASAINASGQVVGDFFTSAGVSHGFLANPLLFTDLGYVYPTDINAKEEVVGQGTGPAKGVLVYYHQGKTQKFLVPISDPGVFVNGIIRAKINDAGQIAGTMNYVRGHASYAQSPYLDDTEPLLHPYPPIHPYPEVDPPYSYYASNQTTHGFLFVGGNFHDLGPAGSNTSRANDINNRGQVVGNFPPARSFLFENGAFKNPAEQNPGEGLATNDLGQVVVAGEETFYLHDSSSVLDLQNFGFPAGTTIRVLALNNSGQIVGAYRRPEFARERAFLWAGGSTVDLNVKAPLATGYVLNSAEDINDAGQIVGIGTKPTGQVFAYLLTPVFSGPMPSAGQDPFPPTTTPGKVPRPVATPRAHVTRRAQITIRGRAKGNISYVMVKANGTKRRISGTASWHFKARLQPGMNTFRIFSVSPDGRRSRELTVSILRK